MKGNEVIQRWFLTPERQGVRKRPHRVLFRDSVSGRPWAVLCFWLHIGVWACVFFLGWPVTSGRAESARIAVLPIVVHSTEDFEYLRTGLADMLFSRLSQTGRLQVVRVQDPAKATTELAAAQEAARIAGAEYVLFGSFTRFGEGASLDVQCAPAQGGEASRRIFVQAGELGAIIPKLDELAGKVAHYVTTGDAGLPAVAAPPPAGGAAVAPAMLSAQELEDLRKRIESIERIVFPAHLKSEDSGRLQSEERGKN